MNNEIDDIQLAPIRTNVTEKLKSLLIESLPQAHPLNADIRAEPSGELSADIIDSVRHVIGVESTAAISAELMRWCADEYDYLDYAEHERKYAITRVRYLVGVLSSRL